MSINLIKPYEISVWEEIFDKNTNTVVENKIAVIGSNTMTGLNKVYDPVFHKKTNGEKTLSFALKYKYFDPYNNVEVVNPFVSLLTNERKVKLYYDKNWYEFIIKEHVESSDELTWTYECVDAFVLELSKIGYNITFDSELNNNQGTAKQLAKEALKNTGWQLGGTDNLIQLIAEPVYKAILKNTSAVNIINANKNEDAVPGSNTNIYVFYNYIKNEDGKNVQFIIRDDNKKYTIDDNNVITDTNFRITTELHYNNTTQQFLDKNNNLIIQLENQINGEQVDPIETRYQVNRLVYNQLTTYDPVMQRTVNRFITGDREVYKYTDNTYTTSNIVTNLITNGNNFNVLEDGTLQGWDGRTYTNDQKNDLSLITYPELGTGKSLVDVSNLSYIEGYLKVSFLGSGLSNTIFNNGIENNSYNIQSIAQGEKFVLRWRAGVGQLDNLRSSQNLRAVIAKYSTGIRPSGYSYRYFNTSDIILSFDSNNNTPKASPNIIEGGTIQNQQYIINGVPQNLSTKYLYRNEDDELLYYWDIKNNRFVAHSSSSSFLNYYYLTATARTNITNADLNDPNKKYGIFIYSTDISEANNGIYYLQDIQLTRFYTDGETGEPILIGNVPVSEAHSTDYYYLKPQLNASAEEVNLYTSLDELKDDLSITTPIKPLYNEDSEKVLSINVSQSNCFDILQTIAETFECWVDIVVPHDESGRIEYSNGYPQKYIYLRQYAGKENYAGFKYGININSIERTVNSEEIVTKLIVDQSQSDYVDGGYVAISKASSNTSGEDYILNFDYYYNQGLLNREESEIYRLNFIRQLAEINKTLRSKEKEFDELSLNLTSIGSQRNVYSELLDKALTNKNKALDTFEQLVKISYEEYKNTHTALPDTSQLTNEETVLKTLGELYANSATINNYSGLLINANEEYWNVRHRLYGAENYFITIWVETDNNQSRHVFIDFSDYLDGFRFKFNNDTTWYNVTANKKYFDVETNAEYVHFEAPSNSSYRITIPECYINDGVVLKNKITTSDSSVVGLTNEIDQLIEDKNELIKDFESIYGRFIQEGTWSSTDYLDSERYYLDAMQVSNTSAQPTVSYTINVVEISELEGLEDYLFDTGDKTYIEDIEFFGWSNVNGVLTPAQEEVIVSEVEWHLESPEQNVITVQNYKTRFEDLFQRISAAVQTVQYNEATYAKMSSLLDSDGTINQNVLLSSLNNITGKNRNLTSDGSILIEEDNIIVRNLTNASNLVKINSEGIRISSDGGGSWATAISGEGIDIGTVFTGVLNTNNVIIGNRSNPSFRWDKSGISAYRIRTATHSADQSYDLQTFVRFDQYGLYGIENNGNFKVQSLEDIRKKAHFAITWDGFFIRNNYKGGGRVEITSNNDFRVLKDVDDTGNETEVIKIGALEWNGSEEVDKNTAPTLYGIRIKGKNGEGNAFKADDQGNLEITGTINATAGNFSGFVNVGPEDKNHIVIDGRDESGSPLIKSSNYSDGAGAGWMINKDGDAVFNNITARGAIKTAVFEYAEIQAVGGIFIFRPSSTIRNAARVDETDDITIIVEKQYLFKVGDWCKISNYTDSTAEPNASAIANNGLTHVYRIKSIDSTNSRILVLENAYAALTSGNTKVINSITDLIGGALVDMGDKDNGDGQPGTNNYGIGINSSDNTVDLPRRAISLFETIIDETANSKVTYNYRGIFGTLPILSYEGDSAKVDQLYHKHLEGSQGVYTDNIYLGDASQYLTFYTDKDTKQKKLKIKASEILYETGDGEYANIGDPAKYIWYDTRGAHVASGVEGIPFNKDNAESFGYNSLMATDRLALRYNNRDLVYLNEDGLIINNNEGDAIASYGDIIKLGRDNDPVHLEIDGNGLSFYGLNRKRISYIESNKLYIPYSVVLNEMVVGARGTREGEELLYILSNDSICVPGKKYFEKNGNSYVSVVDISPNDSPVDNGWYEIDTSDLWAWTVTSDEHLRLVWKAPIKNSNIV